MKEKLAVIGGSGAYKLIKNGLGIEKEKKRVNTPFGKPVLLHLYELKDINFVFLSRHGEKGYSISAPFVDYRANIWALKKTGVERILSWSGPGIINESFRIGEYLIPHDMIDETRGRENTFFKETGIGFIRQKEPFCPGIREALTVSLRKLKLKFQGSGVYVCTQGPRLETPAEIRKFKVIGGDAVGMTLAPEAFLARELEICYAPLCYLTNFAEGIKKKPFKKGELFEGMQTEKEKRKVEALIDRFPDIIHEVFKLLSEKKRDCTCKDSMERYKREGIIGRDWTKWIKAY